MTKIDNSKYDQALPELQKILCDNLSHQYGIAPPLEEKWKEQFNALKLDFKQCIDGCREFLKISHSPKPRGGAAIYRMVQKYV